MSQVTCGVCGIAHTPAYEGATTQGDGCAAEVTKGHLVGHHGSAVADMEVFTFTDAPLPDGTLVCDTCITAMLKDGSLQLLATSDIIQHGG